MAEDALSGWEQRVQTLAANLLTLEINTVVKNGMVAQKMPEVPVALHQIVQDYSDYTRAEVPITHRLLAAAAGRLSDPVRSQHYLKFMSQWANGLAPADPWPGLGDAPPEDPLDLLTNGAETFEALVWAATAARVRAMRAEHATGASPAQQLDNQRRAAILSRIEDNSRQLREVAIVLEAAFSSPGVGDDSAAQTRRMGELQSSAQSYLDRLGMLTGANPATPDPRATRLFGGTIDQTTQALFRHPRPTLNIDPDLTVLIRKVWDIGLEEVRFQTVIQVDGDVLVRVAEMPVDDRDFLASLHRCAVDDGLKQWRLLFGVIGELVTGVGGWLFGAHKGTPTPPSKL